MSLKFCNSVSGLVDIILVTGAKSLFEVSSTSTVLVSNSTSKIFISWDQSTRGSEVEDCCLESVFACDENNKKLSICSHCLHYNASLAVPAFESRVCAVKALRFIVLIMNTLLNTLMTKVESIEAEAFLVLYSSGYLFSSKNVTILSVQNFVPLVAVKFLIFLYLI